MLTAWMRQRSKVIIGDVIFFLQIGPPAPLAKVQVILFEIDWAIFCENLHELFCQFISWTNYVNSGKFMDNCWISCQVMADMKKVYDHLIIINLKIENKFINQKPFLKKSWTLLLTRSFTHFFCWIYLWLIDFL